MEKFEREVLDRLTRLESKIDLQDYKGLSKKVDEYHEKIIKDEEITKDHEKRLAKLENNNQWLWKTVAGALLLGAMAILFGI